MSLVLVGGALALTAPVRPSAAAAVAKPKRPSIVLVLMDDFSSELLPTMPHAMKMKRQGAFFTNSFVDDSLCCVSRTSTFTGRYPHQTKVLTNTPNDPADPIGGWIAFTSHAMNPQRSFNVHLQGSGYTTGFIGKYLNGYLQTKNTEGELVPPPLPPGWDSWQAFLTGGYAEWGFTSTYLAPGDQVQVEQQPVTNSDADYATNVMARNALTFIDSHEGDKRPYFLEVATYGTHSRVLNRKAHPDDPRFPPAYRDRPGHLKPHGNCGLKGCLSLRASDLPGFNDQRTDNTPRYEDGTPATAWQTEATINDAAATRDYRNRARMAQSIDRLIGRVRAAVGPNTYVFLTTDNGFHLGQNDLPFGKGTPYTSDTRVPLLVVGPRVRKGTRAQVVSNIDLAPTFEAIANRKPRSGRSGKSFLRILRRPHAPGNSFAFFEHTFAGSRPTPQSAPSEDPDDDSTLGGTTSGIPSYIAVRSADMLLVRFDLDNSWAGTDYAYELYRYSRAQDYERKNEFAELRGTPLVHDLLTRLATFDACTPVVCRSLTKNS